ncbi:MAG: hypothetical protein ACR2IH_01145 [Pyrinomonadaceae bacterium]
MIDNKLEVDEAERAANYEAIKSDVKAEVGGEIYQEAARPHAAQSTHVEGLAEGMRSRAIDEVAQTQREVDRGRAVARISQGVDYSFFLIYGLLTIRLLLNLFAARQNAGFFQFIISITNPLYAPFRGLMASPSTPEGFTLALPVVVALVVYMLLHLAINGLLRIFAHRKVTV